MLTEPLPLVMILLKYNITLGIIQLNCSNPIELSFQAYYLLDFIHLGSF